MSPKTKNAPDNSLVDGILQRFGKEDNIGGFHQSIISRLIDSAYCSLLDVGKSGEVFIHLPDVFKRDLNYLYNENTSFENGRFYTCSIDSAVSIDPVFKEIGAVKPSHPVSNELIVLVYGQVVCTLVCVKPVPKGSKNDQSRLLEGMIEFQPDNIKKIIDFMAEFIKKENISKDVVDWFETASGRLSRNIVPTEEMKAWGKFLLDFASNSDQFFRTSENKLESMRFLSRFQEAIGWELDFEGMFNAMADIMKDYLKYDYLELVVLKSDGADWANEINLKRNDTDHGGELLTLILKTEAINRIIQKKDAVIVNSEDEIAEYFANPRLISLMALKSCLIMPLTSKDEHKGILKILSCEENHFGDLSREIVTTISRTLSKSIKNIREHTDLQRMATVDGLTNVFNRRFFTELISREFDRARRYESDLSVIMLDIDYFKPYNDTNGHLAGDKALTQVGSILKKNVRGTDVVARYGGEEFVVVLPETKIENGEIVAEKIREAIEKAHFRNQAAQPNGNVTVSLGLASFEPSLESANELVNQADQALYIAKKSGRNRCVVFNATENNQA